MRKPLATIIYFYSTLALTILLASPVKAESLDVIYIHADSMEDGVSTDYQVIETVSSSTTPHVSSSTRIEDFADYLPGVFTGRASAGTTSDLSIRGFSIGGRIYKDGILDNQRLFIRDQSTVEAIEIIKGHNSVQFGSGSPGGTVNYITKKPQSTSINTLKITGGSAEMMRVEHDIAGRINPDSKFEYRVVTAIQKAQTGIENIKDDRFTFMPSLRWKNDVTQVDLSAEYSQRERPYDFDGVIQNGEPVFGVSYAGPRSLSKRHNRFINFDIKHQLGPRIDAHFQGSKVSVDRDERLVGFYYKQNENDLVGYYREVKNDYDQFSLKAEIKGRSSVGRLKNEAIIGVEKNHQDGFTDSRRSIGAFTLDINNPDFSFPLPTGDQLTENDYRTITKDKSVYALNKIILGKRWKLSTGLRKTWFEQDINVVEIDGDAVNETQSDSNALSSAIGLSWSPNNQFVWFAGRNTSFTPNTPDRKLNIFPPKKAVQLETGIRYKSSERDWSLNLAAYDITQSNLALRDPNDRDLKILAGKQRVQGVELRVKKQLTKKLNITASYANMSSKIVENINGLQGNEIYNIPKHSGSINVGYRFNHNNKRDGSVSLGIVAASKRFGDSENSFKVDGYARADLNLNYPIGKKSKLNLSVKNLLGKDYVAAAYSEDTLVMGYPRRAMLSIEHKF